MLDREWVADRGDPMAFLHGWGLNRQVWADLSPALSAVCRPLLLDLPGHGRSNAGPPLGGLQEWAEAVLASVPAHSIWLGWSLGGMVALQAAVSQPAAVRGLILVAANARFSQSKEWPCAVATPVLEGFASDLERDYQGTLNRFLALQARGDERARDTVRRLRRQLAEGGMPQPEALRGGLSILREADLVTNLPQVTCPVLLIGGAYDNLVPVAALERMAAALPAAELCIIKGAAHAPFISHPEEFIAVATRFAARLSEEKLHG